jgi:hypothetical protein
MPQKAPPDIPVDDPEQTDLSISPSSRPPHLGIYNRDEVAKRRAFAWSLRVSGLQYRDIATRVIEEMGEDNLDLPLGYDERAAHRDVKIESERISEELKEENKERRDIAIARLDVAISALMPGVRDGDPKKIMAFLSTMERQARLLGLDAPEQRELALGFLPDEWMETINQRRSEAGVVLESNMLLSSIDMPIPGQDQQDIFVSGPATVEGENKETEDQDTPADVDMPNSTTAEQQDMRTLR